MYFGNNILRSYDVLWEHSLEVIWCTLGTRPFSLRRDIRLEMTPFGWQGVKIQLLTDQLGGIYFGLFSASTQPLCIKMLDQVDWKFPGQTNMWSVSKAALGWERIYGLSRALRHRLERNGTFYFTTFALITNNRNSGFPVRRLIDWLSRDRFLCSDFEYWDTRMTQTRKGLAPESSQMQHHSYGTSCPIHFKKSQPPEVIFAGTRTLIHLPRVSCLLSPLKPVTVVVDLTHYANRRLIVFQISCEQ